MQDLYHVLGDLGPCNPLVCMPSLIVSHGAPCITAAGCGRCAQPGLKRSVPTACMYTCTMYICVVYIRICIYRCMHGVCIVSEYTYIHGCTYARNEYLRKNPSWHVFGLRSDSLQNTCRNFGHTSQVVSGPKNLINPNTQQGPLCTGGALSHCARRASELSGL